MMGSKERHFASLIHVSLEELVPQDQFYRHLERSLDLSFVYEFVKETYAGGGRPSIDPVVFFKLQLVMFFEGIRAARQLMRHAADRLSVRWYVGYDLGEPLPDHSSLTRIRERYGVDVFRRFFPRVAQRAVQTPRMALQDHSTLALFPARKQSQPCLCQPPVPGSAVQGLGASLR